MWNLKVNFRKEYSKVEFKFKRPLLKSFGISFRVELGVRKLCTSKKDAAVTKGT